VSAERPVTATLDDAQNVVIAALEGRLTEHRIGLGWLVIEDIEDGGADRHERVVTFDLVLPDGTRKTFAATIREEEDEWNPDEN
jgi:hypothetical protein